MPLIAILYYSQVINGIRRLFFMLLLINDKRIMGTYVNSRLMNIVSWITVIILIGLSVAMSVSVFI